MKAFFRWLSDPEVYELLLGGLLLFGCLIAPFLILVTPWVLTLIGD